VEFGLGIIDLESTGVFIGDAAKQDPAKNRLATTDWKKMLLSGDRRCFYRAIEDTSSGR
jgi:hypothetical protein